MASLRRAGFLAGLAIAPLAVAIRFAHVYRQRAGFPYRRPPRHWPADLGLPYEETTVNSAAGPLPAWFIPANEGALGPGVVLVHGWDSARDRTLPNVTVLHAAGLHCLTFDVRGHGANPAEELPLSAGEFGADALAAFGVLAGRPEVTAGAISGHSMGAIGAILAAATDPRVGAVVATSGPADPYRLTRQTFRLARLPIPDLIAYPLAWLTTRVYVRPRGHAVASISATAAVARYRGPILLAHGDQDTVVPVNHLRRLAAAALSTRDSDLSSATVETLIVAGGRHSWLYEDEGYRRAVARFLATSLGGPLKPDEAGQAAAAIAAARLPDGEIQFAALEEKNGGLRGLANVALPGATRSRTGQSGATPSTGQETDERVPADPAGRPDPSPAAMKP